MADIPTEDEVRAWLEQSAIDCDQVVMRGAAITAKYFRAAIALLDEARKDRERLDWLQAHADAGFVKLETNAPEFDNDEQRFTVYASKGYRRKFGATLRAAIDQARDA